MSEFSEYKDRLDMREQLARIDRALAENQKFAAEQSKFTAEQAKLQAEALKLSAEADKLRKDAELAPWQVFIVLLTGAAGFFLAGAGFLRLLQ